MQSLYDLLATPMDSVCESWRSFGFVLRALAAKDILKYSIQMHLIDGFGFCSSSKKIQGDT